MDLVCYFYVLIRPFFHSKLSCKCKTNYLDIFHPHILFQWGEMIILITELFFTSYQTDQVAILHHFLLSFAKKSGVVHILSICFLMRELTCIVGRLIKLPLAFDSSLHYVTSCGSAFLLRVDVYFIIGMSSIFLYFPLFKFSLIFFLVMPLPK